MTVISNIYDNNNTININNTKNKKSTNKTSTNITSTDTNTISKPNKSFINLDYLTRFTEIYKENDDKVHTKEGCLTNINYYSNLSHNFNIKDYQVFKKNPFFNQTTSLFAYYGCRNINTKIFNNGMLQMTGIQSEYESIYISKCIINILKNTKIQIYLDNKNLPKTNISNKFAIFYNTKTNNILYYRWDYLNIFKIIEESLKINIYKDCDEHKQLINSYENKWVPDSIINKFLNLINTKLEEHKIKLHNILSGTEAISNKKECNGDSNGNCDGNDDGDGDCDGDCDGNDDEDDCNNTMTNNEIKRIKITEIKIIINYLTNIINKLKNVNDVDSYITKSLMINYKDDLQDLVLEEELPNNIEYNFINNTQKLKLTNTKIELINSDFCVNFIINNTKLHQIIKNKYKIFSSYEPNDYPGVKNKFCWNENKIDQPNQGICTCTPNCVERGKKSICVQITISVFQSGSIIITGSKNIKQIRDAYNFITKILNDNYDEIKGKNNNEEENVKIQEKINNNRKIMRKNQLYFIKKDNITW